MAVTVGNGKTYATLNAAEAGKADPEDVDVYAFNASGDFYTTGSNLSIAKGGNWRCAVAGQKVVMYENDNSAVSLRVTVGGVSFTDFVIYGATSSDDPAYHGMQTTHTSGTVTFESCAVYRSYYANFAAIGNGGTTIWRNCVAWGTEYRAAQGFYAGPGAIVRAHGCSAWGCFSAGFFKNCNSFEVYNCISYGNRYGYGGSTVYDFYNYGGTGNFTGSNNASSDATAPGTGAQTNIVRGDLGAMCDNIGGAGLAMYGCPSGMWLMDGVGASKLENAGVAVAGLTRDFIGNTRADPPNIGPIEGFTGFGGGGSSPPTFGGHVARRAA